MHRIAGWYAEIEGRSSCCPRLGTGCRPAPKEAAGLLPLSMILGHRPTVVITTIHVGRPLPQRHGGSGGNETNRNAELGQCVASRDKQSWSTASTCAPRAGRFATWNRARIRPCDRMSHFRRQFWPPSRSLGPEDRTGIFRYSRSCRFSGSSRPDLMAEGVDGEAGGKRRWGIADDEQQMLIYSMISHAVYTSGQMLEIHSKNCHFCHLLGTCGAACGRDGLARQGVVGLQHPTRPVLGRATLKGTEWV